MTPSDIERATDATIALLQPFVERIAELTRQRDEARKERDEKLWTCPDCAFTFCAYHTNADGSLTCPLCELQAANETIEDILGGQP